MVLRYDLTPCCIINFVTFNDVNSDLLILPFHHLTGRFGNQEAHLLGVLDFAKRLNRTLVIPPWRSRDVSYMVYYPRVTRIDHNQAS